MVAQHDRRAHPFANLSQVPEDKSALYVCSSSQNAPIDEVNHVLCIKVMQKSFIPSKYNMTHRNMMMKVNDNIYIISTLLLL